MRGARCRAATLIAAAAGGLAGVGQAVAQTPEEITYNYADVRIRYDAASGALVVEDHAGTSLRSSLRDAGGVVLDQANIPLASNFNVSLSGTVSNPAGSEDLFYAATLAGSDLDLSEDAYRGDFLNGSMAPDVDGFTFVNGILFIRGSLEGASSGSMLIEPAGPGDWVFKGSDDVPVGPGLDGLAAQYTVSGATRGQYKTGTLLYLDIVVNSFADGTSTAGILNADAFFTQAALHGGFESTGGDLQISIVRSPSTCDCPSDTTPPTITCPDDVALECNDPTDPDHTGYPTASDDCDQEVDISYSDSMDGGCPIIITRTWTATDECGNTATCDQIISIDDTLPPTITCPPDVTIECDQPSDPDATGYATADDACDPDVAVSFEDHSDGTCPVVVTRVWTATDACGNTATCDQVITIQDTTPPTLDCPPDVTIGCNDSTDPGETGEAGALDNCDVAVELTYEDVVSDGCPKVITRTWTATDICGNTVSCDQIITVVDDEAPVIDCPPDVTLECGDMDDAGEATAYDDCDADVEITYTDSSNGTCPTVITRTWIARDDCGNESSCVQYIVHGDDNERPKIYCPPNKWLQCDESTDPSNTGCAWATDDCDTSVRITYSDYDCGSCPKVIRRTWKAYDDCGNRDTCVQTITVDDTKKPVLTCPPDITIPANESTNPCRTGFATAVDNCDRNVRITYCDDSSGCGRDRVIRRTWRATDDCCNTATCVQTITIGREDEGCSPGYWKSNCSWPSCYRTHNDFDSTFGVSVYHPNRSLLDALRDSDRTGRDALAREAVAALLNAAHYRIDFPLTESQVKSMVRDAFRYNGDIEGTRRLLEEMNDADCPLH